MSRIYMVVILMVCLSACTSMGRLEKGTNTVASDESVFIMGLSPDNYRVSLFPGSVDDGAFKQSPWRNAAFYGAPEDGFIVGKVKAGDIIGLMYILIVKDEKAVRGDQFGACDGARTMVFEAPDTGGKVIYLGEVHYELVDGRVMIKYGSDIEAARQYIDKFYPAFSGDLERWSYELLPVNASCVKTIDVYIP